MTTISTIPVYPPPGKRTKVAFNLQETGANWVRVWVTAAPPGSEFRAQLEAKPQHRIPIYNGPGGSNEQWVHEFDVGGGYVLTAQEYIKGSLPYGGGYQGDPNGAPSETKVGDEYTLTLYIGQRVTSTIRAGNDSVDIVLWCWSDTIRETSKATHGEDSPAVVKESPSTRERYVIDNGTVRGNLSALIDQSVSTALGSVTAVLGTAAGAFIKEWNDHLADAAVHEDADADNLIPTGLASAAHSQNLPDAINEILTLVRYHYTNDAVKGGTVSGRDSGNYHNKTDKVNDNTNAPIVQSVSTPADAYWALAELHRSYTAHRQSTAVHDSADSTNVLSSLPPLLVLASSIYAVFASTSPTVPSTQSEGVVLLTAVAGFEESPL